MQLVCAFVFCIFIKGFLGKGPFKMKRNLCRSLRKVKPCEDCTNYPVYPGFLVFTMGILHSKGARSCKQCKLLIRRTTSLFVSTLFSRP